LQVFKTWGIVLDPKIATNVEHRQKTIWRLETQRDDGSLLLVIDSTNAGHLFGSDVLAFFQKLKR